MGFALCGRADRVAKSSLHGFHCVATDRKIKFAAVSRNPNVGNWVPRPRRSRGCGVRHYVASPRSDVLPAQWFAFCNRLRQQKSPAYLNGTMPVKYDRKRGHRILSAELRAGSPKPCRAAVRRLCLPHALAFLLTRRCAACRPRTPTQTRFADLCWSAGLRVAFSPICSGRHENLNTGTLIVCYYRGGFEMEDLTE